jgi:hypothetical protein
LKQLLRVARQASAEPEATVPPGLVTRVVSRWALPPPRVLLEDLAFNAPVSAGAGVSLPGGGSVPEIESSGGDPNDDGLAKFDRARGRASR